MEPAWDPAYKRESKPEELDDGSWCIENVRDFSFGPDGSFKEHWETKK